MASLHALSEGVSFGVLHMKSASTLKEDHDYSYVTIYPFFGRVEMESRMRREGNRLIGEGRAKHYDAAGVLTKDTGWEPTGVVLIEPPQEPWWKLW